MNDIVLIEKVDHLEKSIIALSRTVKTQGKALGRVEQKVFNGFGTKIDNINANMIRDREVNEIAHADMRKTLGAIIKFGATSFVTIFVVLLSILGSIWFQNDTNIPVEVVRNVPIVVPYTASP